MQEKIHKQVTKLLKEKPADVKMSCNCAKTKCLKKYCDCFAAGYYCDDTCNCMECCNFEKNMDDVIAARIKAT